MLATPTIKPFDEAAANARQAADIAAARHVRALCARASALRNPAETENCWGPFIRMQSEILAVIVQIEDDFCREFAIFYTIEMCMDANDLTLSRSLLTQLTIIYFKIRVMQLYPHLLSLQ